MLPEYFVPSLKMLGECLVKGNFVLESLFCVQRLWILNLFWPTLSYGPYGLTD